MKRFRKSYISIGIILILIFSLVGCSNVKTDSTQKNYEGRTYYEIFVRSFKDSNGDGVGDLNGITEKLDYLKDLGINGIWLMPICKSPSYHGYDVSDYYSIQPEYGTLDDLQNLIDEAHKRDIKVIMDFEINHTSTQNQWFIDASTNKSSPYRDYYIWTDDMSKVTHSSAMGTKDWTKNGSNNELYYSIFDKGMPDLNMDNPNVVNEVERVAKFYLDKGIDGFRLDAAKWIFDQKSKNVAFWKEFNQYIKSVNPNAITVGEVWDAPYNNIEYTDGLDSFFEFSTGPYIISRINGKSIGGFPNDYQSVQKMYTDNNPDFVVASFLTNHDQVRIMNSLNDDFKMKEAALMNLTVPGTSFIYYGEETGMEGGKPDEQIREPFIWDDKDTSKNTSWELSTNDASKVAVSEQEQDKNSILNFYKDILKVKNNNKSLRYGEMKSIDNNDSDVMVMERTYQGETSYVIINDNDSAMDVAVPAGKYQVLYSNEDKKGTIKIKDKTKLSSKEILILKKN